MLFVPGNKEKMLQKSLQAVADSLIWDLEDAVAMAEKDSARATIGAALRSLPQQHLPVFVRINAVSTGMLEADLVKIVTPGLFGVLLPKAATASDVHELERTLARLEKAN